MPTKPEVIEACDEFESAMATINESVDHAMSILEEFLPGEVPSARAYWHSQIQGIVDGSFSMQGMQESLDALRASVEEAEDV